MAAAHGENVVNTGTVCRSTFYTWGKGYNSLPELSPGIVAAHAWGKGYYSLPELSPGIAAAHGKKVITAYLSLVLEWLLLMGKRLY